MGAAKLLTSNMLARSEVWQLDPGSLTMPPLVQTAAPIAYANIPTGGGVYAAFTFDGDQDLPFFFNANPGFVRITFNVAVTPKAIALINHNCNDTGDKIEIYAGPNTGAMVLIDTIQSPNRSVDAFYPFRFNDAWINSGAINQHVWRVDLIKASGLAYLGELFFASEYYEFEDFDPQPNYDIGMQFSRRKATHEFYSGESADYDLKSPIVSYSLNWSKKSVYSGSFDLFVDWVAKHMDALNQSPSRQVLIWRDDRVCMFGKLEEGAALGWSPEKSPTPRYAFQAEYPRRFFRDELD
jgi:hypothetical protein